GFRLFRRHRRPREKTVQMVRDKVRKPGAAERRMSLQPPQSKFSNVQLHAVKRKEQTSQALMLKDGDVFKPGAIFQDTVLGKHLVDAVQPLLQIAAAAL